MLELQRNLYVLRRWWWLLAAGLLIGAAAAYGLTKVLVKQQYQATAIIALAPPPQGPNGLYVTSLAASADSQLVSTLATSRAALRQAHLPSGSSVDANQLSTNTAGTSTLDGQILYVTVKWSDATLAPALANAVAGAFLSQERSRLAARYGAIHRSLVAQEQRLMSLASSSPGSGAARSWLQAQYADSVSKVYQTDADAQIQTTLQQQALQIAQPAVSTTKVGPKATVNAALGAALGFLIALIVAFVATSDYSESKAPAVAPVMSRVAE